MGKRKIILRTAEADFEILNYTVAGPALRGKSDKKVFFWEGKYYKNHEGQLLEVKEFIIRKSGREISKQEFLFDTAVRAGAVIVCGKELMLIHRTRPGRDYYTYPGGHVKQGESLEQAIIREIKEETNLDISECKLDLILRQHNIGFGPERFFLVEIPKIPSDLYELNPETRVGEARIVWLDISAAVALPTLVPPEVIGLVALRFN